MGLFGIDLYQSGGDITSDPGGVGGVGGLVLNRFASSDPGGVGGVGRLVWNRFASVRW